MKYPCPVCGKYCRSVEEANNHCKKKMNKIGDDAKQRWRQS